MGASDSYERAPHPLPPNKMEMHDDNLTDVKRSKNRKLKSVVMRVNKKKKTTKSSGNTRRTWKDTDKRDKYKSKGYDYCYNHDRQAHSGSEQYSQRSIYGRADPPINAYIQKDCPTTPIYPLSRSECPSRRSECTKNPRIKTKINIKENKNLLTITIDDDEDNDASNSNSYIEISSSDCESISPSINTQIISENSHIDNKEESDKGIDFKVSEIAAAPEPFNETSNNMKDKLVIPIGTDPKVSGITPAPQHSNEKSNGLNDNVEIPIGTDTEVSKIIAAPESSNEASDILNDNVEISSLNIVPPVPAPAKKPLVSEIDILESLRNEILNEGTDIRVAEVATPLLHQPKITKSFSAQGVTKKRISIKTYKEKYLSSAKPSLFVNEPFLKSQNSIKKTSLKLTEEEQQRFKIILPLSFDDSSDDDKNVEDLYSNLAPKSPEHKDDTYSSAPSIIIASDPVNPPVASKAVPLKNVQLSSIKVTSEIGALKVIKNVRPPLLDPRMRRDFNSIGNSPNPNTINPERTPTTASSIPNIAPNMTPRSYEMNPSHQSYDFDSGVKSKKVYASAPAFHPRDNRDHVFNTDDQESHWESYAESGNDCDYRGYQSHSGSGQDYQRSRYDSEKYYKAYNGYEQDDNVNRMHCPGTPLNSYGRENCPATPYFSRAHPSMNTYIRKDCSTTPIHENENSDRSYYKERTSDEPSRSYNNRSDSYGHNRNESIRGSDNGGHNFIEGTTGREPNVGRGTCYDKDSMYSRDLGKYQDYRGGYDNISYDKDGLYSRDLGKYKDYRRGYDNISTNNNEGRNRRDYQQRALSKGRTGPSEDRFQQAISSFDDQRRRAGSVGSTLTHVNPPESSNGRYNQTNPGVSSSLDQAESCQASDIVMAPLTPNINNEYAAKSRRYENRDRSNCKELRSNESSRFYNKRADSYGHNRNESIGESNNGGHNFIERTTGRELSVGRGTSYDKDSLYSRAVEKSKDDNISTNNNKGRNRRDCHQGALSEGRTGPSEDRFQRAISSFDDWRCRAGCVGSTLTHVNPPESSSGRYNKTNPGVSSSLDEAESCQASDIVIAPFTPHINNEYAAKSRRYENRDRSNYKERRSDESSRSYNKRADSYGHNRNESIGGSNNGGHNFIERTTGREPSVGRGTSYDKDSLYSRDLEKYKYYRGSYDNISTNNNEGRNRRDNHQRALSEGRTGPSEDRFQRAISSFDDRRHRAGSVGSTLTHVNPPESSNGRYNKTYPGVSSSLDQAESCSDDDENRMDCPGTPLHSYGRANYPATPYFTHVNPPESSNGHYNKTNPGVSSSLDQAESWHNFIQRKTGCVPSVGRGTSYDKGGLYSRDFEKYQDYRRGYDNISTNNNEGRNRLDYHHRALSEGRTEPSEDRFQQAISSFDDARLSILIESKIKEVLSRSVDQKIKKKPEKLCTIVYDDEERDDTDIQTNNVDMNEKERMQPILPEMSSISLEATNIPTLRPDVIDTSTVAKDDIETQAGSLDAEASKDKEPSTKITKFLKGASKNTKKGKKKLAKSLSACVRRLTRSAVLFRGNKLPRELRLLEENFKEMGTDLNEVLNYTGQRSCRLAKVVHNIQEQKNTSQPVVILEKLKESQKYNGDKMVDSEIKRRHKAGPKSKFKQLPELTMAYDALPKIQSVVSICAPTADPPLLPPAVISEPAKSVLEMATVTPAGDVTQDVLPQEFAFQNCVETEDDFEIVDYDVEILKHEFPVPEEKDTEDLCNLYAEICDPDGLRYKCPLCKQVTADSKNAMETHLFEELHYRKWACSFCFHKTFHKTDMYQHTATEHRLTGPAEPEALPVDTRVEGWVNMVLAHQTSVIESRKRPGETNSTPNTNPTENSTSEASPLECSEEEMETLRQAFGEFGKANDSKFCCPKCYYQITEEAAMIDHLEMELDNIRWRCSACGANLQSYHDALFHCKSCRHSGQMSRPVEAVRDPNVRAAWVTAVIQTQKKAMEATPEPTEDEQPIGPLENSLLVARKEKRVRISGDEIINKRIRQSRKK